VAVSTRITNSISEYPKMIWFLAFACFLNIGGLSFLWPINSIYIHEELGKPMTVASIVLMFHSAGAAVGSLLGGTLFDRIGGRPVLLIGLSMSAIVLTLIGVFDSWALYVTVMILFGFSALLTIPTLNALGAKVWPEGGRRAFNFLYVANNLGVAAGTAAGGLVAQYSFQAAFLAAAATMLLLLIFAFFFIRDPKATGTPAQGATDSGSASQEVAAASAQEDKVPWVPIISLFVAFVMVWIVYVQWQSSLSVVMHGKGISLAAYSLIWTVNGLVIFFGQPIIAYLVRFFQSLSSQMFLGTGLFITTFAVLLFTDSYAGFMTGMVIMTFGEMLLWPGIPAAVAQLSPPSRLGFLQGLIGSAGTVGRMIGPLIGGLLYDHTTFGTLLAVMLCLLSIPLISFSIYAKTGKTARNQQTAA